MDRYAHHRSRPGWCGLLYVHAWPGGSYAHYDRGLPFLWIKGVAMVGGIVGMPEPFAQKETEKMTTRMGRVDG